MKESIATLKNRKLELHIKALPASLGRNNNTVDVYLFHESVSREHCLFECINHGITVRDLNSTAGTFINGVRLEPNIPYNIEDGAKIRFGKVKMTFHADYQALEEWIFTQENSSKSEPVNMSKNAQRDSAFTYEDRKRIKVSAREMADYEYDEEEVIYIECGLKPAEKPLSYTSELRKSEIEAAALAEEARVGLEFTQILDPGDAGVLELALPEEDDQDKFRQTIAIESNELESEADDDFEEEESAEDLSEDDAQEIPAENDVKFEKEIKIEDRNEEFSAIEAEPEDENGYDSDDDDTLELERQDIEDALISQKTLHLSWIDDISGETKKLNIDHFPFAIGRKSDVNDYTIARKGISRKHMRFEESDGELFIYDEASTNGIRLNGEKISPETLVKLNSGDSIRVLDITFKVTIE